MPESRLHDLREPSPERGLGTHLARRSALRVGPYDDKVAEGVASGWSGRGRLFPLQDTESALLAEVLCAADLVTIRRNGVFRWLESSCGGIRNFFRFTTAGTRNISVLRASFRR